LTDLSASEDGAPLGVYIHWPYCERICPYCDFNVVRDRGRSAKAEALVEAIAADLEAQAALTGPMRLASVYFGGGTPSLMPPEAVARLVALARRLWAPEADLEVTLEANPTDAEVDRFSAFRAAGVNRLSLGVQALDDAPLEFLKRNHDAAAAERAVATAVKTVPRVSLDLIYALPGQGEAEWRATLARAAELGVEHVSAYQLTIEGTTPFGRAVARGRMPGPDPDRGADLYEATVAALAELGFDAYEVSNFARGTQARSRHNLVYWRGQAYVGAGPGAHGRLTLDGARWATEAERGIEAYVQKVAETGTGWAVREAFTPQETLEERILMGLRVDEGVALSDIAALDRLAALEPLVEGGWLMVEGDRVRATPAGRLLLDRVSGELLA
jgi:putative oxygen-independent coproporphyrinogen III oxidase